MMRFLVPFLSVVACAVLAAGCGDDDAPPSTRPPERADAPASVPPGWTRVSNARSGFTLALPPGWTARGARGSTLIRSADGALGAAVSSDRSADGERQPLPAYVRATLTGLPGYRGLRTRDPVSVKGARYLTVRATGTGTFARTGVRQAITLYAIRRPGQVTYTLLFFRSAQAPGGVYAPAITTLVGSFRAMPAEF